MPKTVKFEGKTYSVPDDATMDEIQSLIEGPQKVSSPPSIPRPPLPAGLQPPQPGFGDTVPGALMLGVNPSMFAERLGGAAGSVLNTMFPAGDTPRPNTLPPMSPNEEIGARTAALGGVATGTQALASALAKRLPSITRAGAKFQEVMGAAKDAPLNLKPTAPIVERAQDIAAHGGPPLPKVFRDFVKNRKTATGDFMGTPVPEPMTYEVGRDFASNAGSQSIKAKNAQNAAMQRQVAQFSDAMKTANREAATQVGMGDLYDAAMKEYRQAKSLADAAATIKKYAVRAAMVAGLGAAGKLGYDLYNR